MIIFSYDGSDYDCEDFEFADPGGKSALRAATRDNPRIYPCPTCGAEEDTGTWR